MIFINNIILNDNANRLFFGEKLLSPSGYKYFNKSGSRSICLTKNLDWSYSCGKGSWLRKSYSLCWYIKRLFGCVYINKCASMSSSNNYIYSHCSPLPRSVSRSKYWGI